MIRPLWIEVDQKALGDNFKAIENYVGNKVKVIATIKQSAYGHGLISIARGLSAKGADFFGVGSIEEAVALREDGSKAAIIVLSAVLAEFAYVFLEYDIVPTIVDSGFAQALNKQAAKKGKTIPVHVKIDTGMGRLGLYHKHAHKFIAGLSQLKNIRLEGLYTHFPAADSDPEFTNYQIEAFNTFNAQLKKEGIHFKFFHCANSIGIINYPEAHFNMVRPGLILYGIKPLNSISLGIKPVLALKSKVIFVKKIQKGMSVSYARTYIADRDRYIATAAVGYADGYPWSLSNRSRVIIKDSSFNVAGRVCMDHIMIDLKERGDIKAGDEVILIGASKDNKISVEELAAAAKTIPYEIISRLSPSIPRIYKK